MPEGAGSGGQLDEPPLQGSLINRRQFLRGAAVAAGGLAAMGMGGKKKAKGHKIHAHAKHPRHPTQPAVVQTMLDSGVVVPTARWLIEENAKAGTNNWVVTGIQTPHAIEGFASQVSAAAGDELVLFVNTTAQSFHVEAYRMGYYQGLAGRLIDTSATVGGTQQPSYTVTPGVNTVTCPWQPSLTLSVTKNWPPGNYLLKLVGDGGEQQYIPLTVRDDTSTATYVFQNSVTTWQAYNLWGGYSLYGRGATGGDFSDRSRIVSFDRPYPQTWAQGAADFFGNEFPLLYDMEQLGLDMTYWTDIDLHANPNRLASHKALFTLGHDEYWSYEMREGAQSALNGGTNLAFMGANAVYRQIRLSSSPVGANRLQACYKDAAEDPISSSDPQLTTVDWNQAPLDNPESSLVGSMYQSVRANDDLVVTDSSSWFWNGTGLTDGTAMPRVVQGEYDRYVPSLPGPKNLDVLAHSPVAGQGNWSDMTYYSTTGGGGVFASGMASFVFKLSNTTEFPAIIVPAAIPGTTDVLLRAMENLYGVFGAGPASGGQPSGGNWTSIYQGSAATAPSAQGTNIA
jgi:hypothetical protein